MKHNMEMIKMTAPVKANVGIDIVDQIDIRVGTIRIVEDVANSKKLVKLDVDFGGFTRTILVGMKGEREDPKEVEGKQALFIVNLEPRKMAGELSEGMLLTSAMRTKSHPCSRSPKNRCLTVQGRDKRELRARISVCKCSRLHRNATMRKGYFLF